MVKDVTWYPGVGADDEIARLERLIGKITAYWAQVEDGLFTVFVFAQFASGNDPELGGMRSGLLANHDSFVFARMRCIRHRARVPRWLEKRSRVSAFASSQ